MQEDRRAFLFAVFPAALIITSIAEQQPLPAPFPSRDPQSPPFPREPGQEGPKVDPKLVLKENQKEIHSDVERLFKLAQELKDESDKADAAQVLSLPLIKKAEEIEKLAKQIKSLARYS